MYFDIIVRLSTTLHPAMAEHVFGLVHILLRGVWRRGRSRERMVLVCLSVMMMLVLCVWMLVFGTHLNRLAELDQMKVRRAERG